MRIRAIVSLLLVAVAAHAMRATEPAGAEAVVILMADEHSAYDRAAQLVAQVDALRAAHPRLPMAILIDGDVFEHGNVIALRSGGAIDFAMLAACARRAPTILNLGNHEADFFAMAETVRRVEATGVSVIGNIVDRRTGQPFAPASRSLKFGSLAAVVVGLAPNRLATFRAEVRPEVEIPDPVSWANQHLATLLGPAPVRIVLSHAGVLADRAILPRVPDGTLYAGAHDHLQFIHRAGRTVYVHSGYWNTVMTLAWLRRAPGGDLGWEIEQRPIAATDAADPALAKAIREIEARYRTPADAAVVGHTRHAYTPIEAERFVTAAVRDAAHVDAAFIGHTTFGGGLPAGAVTQLAFDAWVRFDGTIYTGEIDGAKLQELLAHANQSPETPWSERTGEYLVAVGPMKIDAAQRYRVAVTDWIARSPATFLGADPPKLTEHAELHLKSIARRALSN